MDNMGDTIYRKHHSWAADAPQLWFDLESDNNVNGRFSHTSTHLQIKY